MPSHDIYLVCHEYLPEVRKFLQQFYEEEQGDFNHEKWVTFVISSSSFRVNLMAGSDQPLSQNVTFEIGFDDMSDLYEFAEKHGAKISSFQVTEVMPHYNYHYVELVGPKGICKLEANFCEIE